ncbi:phosphoribosylformylglycinamidine synthase, purS protein [Helicobacter sp. 12S02634-8]|uniref:phosphoribosylformylglycinamidine synthase subunit PurS n=1 Tax=Helicobacter sp. 12S02634-8 TaxID=1476199 RepID=UPI000BA7C0C5|nr:phosphoribosylformylglycinamidine synthase subunit PurS [Helicobacter sp. 12S02634-8]PAF48525.1 phosphoribosylformylglycinamidine synthase, purS protein [Helicobacter sp. 12S02634-8]
MKITINTSLKDGVLDPQAKAIMHALQTLGFTEVTDLKLSKNFTLEFAHDDKQKALAMGKTMAEELLANTVIEDYRIIEKED